MKIKTICGVAFAYLLLIIICSAHASTPISGLIVGNVTWSLAGSPYIIVGATTVTLGSSLKIDPGVVVKFDRYYALQVDGELIARGTEANRITFTSNQAVPGPNDWRNIVFKISSTDAVYDSNNNYVGGCILEHCTVEFAGYSNNGGIRIEDASPFINHCIINNNSSSAISVIDQSSPRITNNSILNNNASLGGGIYLYTENGRPIIFNNIITDNTASSGAGIFARIGGGAEFIALISHNIIRNNQAVNGGGGVFCDGLSGSSCTVTDNFIINNRSNSHLGGGIWAYRSSISKNIVADNVISGKGGGIWAMSCSIENNSIVNNNCQWDGTDNMPTGGVVIESYAYSFKLNTVTLNSVPGFYPGGILNGSPTTTFNDNNIFNNIGIELFNGIPQGSLDLQAENCYWGTNDELIIQQEIFDGRDNVSYGIVDYQPYLSVPNTTTPISPPTQIKAVPQLQGVRITWSNNKESDLAGYKVYWGSKAGYPYDNVADVGNVTSYLIEGILPNIRFVTVTAYDSDYNSGNDNPATLVNENQVNGNESWYAPEQKVNYNHSASTISSILSILLLDK